MMRQASEWLASSIVISGSISMDVVWDGKIKRRRGKVLKHTAQKEIGREGAEGEQHRVGSSSTLSTTTTPKTKRQRQQKRKEKHF